VKIIFDDKTINAEIRNKKIIVVTIDNDLLFDETYKDMKSKKMPQKNAMISMKKKMYAMAGLIWNGDGFVENK
jgi:hypothetical protein